MECLESIFGHFAFYDSFCSCLGVRVDVLAIYGIKSTWELNILNFKNKMQTKNIECAESNSGHHVFYDSSWPKSEKTEYQLQISDIKYRMSRIKFWTCLGLAEMFRVLYKVSMNVVWIQVPLMARSLPGFKSHQLLPGGFKPVLPEMI